MNDNKNKIVELDLNDVLPNRFQPRIKFNEESIIELSESVKKHGVIQPIIVRPIGDKFEIVAGERRYKACVLAGLPTIPSVILDLDDCNSVEVALIENIQRKDLTPIEEAISYKKILDMGYLTQEQLAAKLGKSQSAIANKKRLLNLCDEVQEALMEEKISERHARSLLKLTTPDEQREMLKRVVSERLTVRKLDEEIQKVLEKPSSIKSEKIDSVEHTQTIKDIVQEEESEDDIIDLSKLFAILPDIKDKDEIVKENSTQSLDNDVLAEQPVVEDSVSSTQNIESVILAEKPIVATEGTIDDDVETKKIISESNFEEMKEKGEKDNMITNFQDSNNQFNSPISGGDAQVVSSKSFGRFFDPAYFDTDIKDVSVPSTPTEFKFDNTGSSSNIFGLTSESSTPSVISVSSVQTQQPVTPVQSVPLSDLFDDSGRAVASPFSSVNEPAIPMGATPSSVASISVEQPVPVQQINSQPTLMQGETSMFANLMQEQVQNSSEVIDAQTFNDFLDPTIVDGQKQAELPVNQGIIDSNVFAKFLDPEYDMTEYNNKVKEQEELQKQPQIIPSMSFAQYLNSDKPVEEIAAASNMDNTLTMTSASKPDLMAPMGDSNMTFNSTPESEFTPASSLSVFNTPTLTPDVTFSEPTPVPEPVVVSEPVIPTEPEMPAFITASEPTIDYSMPTTPIIESPDINSLLSTTPITPIDSVPSEPVVTPVVPTPISNTGIQFDANGIVTADVNTVPPIPIPNTGIQFNTSGVVVSDETTPSTPVDNIASQINNQPIIITDYNKQYDPVLPVNMVSQVPKTDFKQVLNMIRSLNDQIESLGFTIDTEEYDLDDVYQVIFKINKPE